MVDEAFPMRRVPLHLLKGIGYLISTISDATCHRQLVKRIAKPVVPAWSAVPSPRSPACSVADFPTKSRSVGRAVASLGRPMLRCFTRLAESKPQPLSLGICLGKGFQPNDVTVSFPSLAAMTNHSPMFSWTRTELAAMESDREMSEHMGFQPQGLGEST